KEQKEKEEPLKVRPLKVKKSLLPGPGDERWQRGKDPVKVFRSAEELEKVVGKKAAAALLEQVDLDKEGLVLVSWTGGDKAKLVYEVTGTGKDRAVEFSVQEPPADDKPQLLVGRIDDEFFAVPRKTPVRFASQKKEADIPATAPKEKAADSKEDEI